MTQANAARCIARTIDKYEGGFDNDARDRGNWTSGKIGVGELKGTKYGIAAFVYPTLDIKNLSKENAVALYQRDYWPKIAGDQLPVGADFTTWDCCVNSGNGRAYKCATKALSVQITSGPGLAAEFSKRQVDVEFYIKDFNASRRSFLIGLHNATYQNGWLKRVADCEATSLAWHYTDAHDAEAAKKKLNEDAEQADRQRASSKGSAAGTTAGTVATAGHATLATKTPWMTYAEWGLVVGIITLTVYFAFKAIVHRHRAVALRAAVAGIGG